jgi:hypothetical protein
MKVNDACRNEYTERIEKWKISERKQMFWKLEKVYRINSSTKCGKEAYQKTTPERSQRWLNRIRQQLWYVKWTIRTVNCRQYISIRYGKVTFRSVRTKHILICKIHKQDTVSVLKHVLCSLVNMSEYNLMFFWPCIITVQTCFNYQLNAQVLYSITIYMLHYNPRRVSNITMLIFRRSNCIVTASGIVSLCKRHTVQPFTDSDNTRCCNNTIWPPEDEHCNVRNTSRIIM